MAHEVIILKPKFTKRCKYFQSAASRLLTSTKFIHKLWYTVDADIPVNWSKTKIHRVSHIILTANFSHVCVNYFEFSVVSKVVFNAFLASIWTRHKLPNFIQNPNSIVSHYNRLYSLKCVTWQYMISWYYFRNSQQLNHKLLSWLNGWSGFDVDNMPSRLTAH